MVLPQSDKGCDGWRCREAPHPDSGSGRASWEKRQKSGSLREERGKGVFQVEETTCRKNGWLEKLEEVTNLEQSLERRGVFIKGPAAGGRWVQGWRQRN